MRNKLEQFVDEHAEELDIYQPKEDLWDGVSEGLQHRSKNLLWQRMAIAASLLLLVTCAAWIFVANRQSNSIAVTNTSSQLPIKEAEVYFTAMVQMKDAELEQYCGPQPELCSEFESDMSMLTRAYEQLKKEQATSADKDQILKAMMTNLQMRVQLISRQLQIMEAVKQKKSEAHVI